MKRRKIELIIIGSMMFLLAPSPAQAHLVQTGFGKFYDGAAHMLITTSDLMVVLALGLFAGLRGAASSRSALILLPASWMTGGLLGAGFPTNDSLSLWMTLSFFVVGVFVAVDLKLPQRWIILLVCVEGLLHGYGNGASMFTTGMGTLALIGATTTIFIIVTILSALVFSLRATWTRIAVRVAGSWIAAVGLLMIGWIAHGNGL